MIPLLLGLAAAWTGNGNTWILEDDVVTDGFELNTDGFDDPAATEEAFRVSLAIWNADGQSQIYIPYMGLTDNSTYGGGDDDHNVTMFTAVTFSSALAQSRYNSIGPEMIDCDTEFYGANVYGPKTWSTDVENGAGSGEYDFIHTAVHEIGHCLGFSHSGVDGAIMGTTNSSGTGWERRWLQPDDREGYQAMYGAGAAALDIQITEDGAARPGQTVGIQVAIANTGTAPIVDVLGTLVVDGPLTLVQDADGIGDLPPGASGGTLADTLDFEVRVDESCADTEATLTVQITDWLGNQVDHEHSLALNCAVENGNTELEDGMVPESPAVGCGCATGSGPVGWLGLLPVLWMVRRNP